MAELIGLVTNSRAGRAWFRLACLHISVAAQANVATMPCVAFHAAALLLALGYGSQLSRSRFSGISWRLPQAALLILLLQDQHRSALGPCDGLPYFSVPPFSEAFACASMLVTRDLSIAMAWSGVCACYCRCRVSC